MLILETFILSMAICLLFLAINRLRASHRDSSRPPNRPHEPLLTYALIPLIVSLGLKAGFLSYPGDWIASLQDERIYLQRRCSRGAQFDPVAKKTAIQEFIQACAVRYGLDPLLIHAIVSIESNFDPKAVSSRGAMGLMQLTAQTTDYLGVRDPFDPHENIEGGIYYLKLLLGRYRKNLRLTLAAYNAGPERVKRYRGVPPYPETKQYVRKVLKQYRRLKNRHQKNLAGKPKR